MPTLRLFASAREAAGTARAEIEAATVAELLDKARGQFGDRFGRVLDTSRVWVNGQPAELGTAISGHDIVAVLPPVSGGSNPAAVGAPDRAPTAGTPLGRRPRPPGAPAGDGRCPAPPGAVPPPRPAPPRLRLRRSGPTGGAPATRPTAAGRPTTEVVIAHRPRDVGAWAAWPWPAVGPGPAAARRPRLRPARQPAGTARRPPPHCRSSPCPPRPASRRWRPPSPRPRRARAPAPEPKPAAPLAVVHQSHPSPRPPGGGVGDRHRAAPWSPGPGGCRSGWR